MAKQEKIVIRIPTSKPRNPYVVLTLMRRAGVHGQSYKSARQQYRQRLQASFNSLLNEESSEFEIE